MTLYIVVPCYNEEAVLEKSAGALKRKLLEMNASGLVDKKSKILFVDDGSRDTTWEIIKTLCQGDELFQAIRLSANKGHQSALYAGLMTAKEFCDAAISIDADLQDDVEVMSEFVEKFNGGCDVVFGVRKSRKTDKLLKKLTADSFYKLSRALGADIINNHADYRLMSKRALDALSEYQEVNLFLRGIARQIGYRSEIVLYDRAPRADGESKYTVSKMLRLASDGITSFTTKPLDLIGIGSLIFSLLGASLLFAALVLAIIGKSSLAFLLSGSVWLALGIQLFAMWLLGKYVGKIYAEVKHRPRYIIAEQILSENNK